MNSKEQKLMRAAMDLHYNCDEQHDCTHCLFGKGGIPCKVSGIPSEWFKDELMPEGVERLRDATETICTATSTSAGTPPAPELTELLAHIYRFYDEEEAEFEKTMLTIRLMLFLMIEQEKDRLLRDDSKKEERELTKTALEELLKQMETK